jgi:thiamine-phosphate pyrophosphorylase
MSWKNSAFQNFKLYAITDLQSEDANIFERVDAACRGGADIIQLRSKHLPDAALLRLGARIREIAFKNQKLFFVNDRPDLALALKANGAHVGQEDLPIAVIRKLVGRRPFWIGKSTHSLEQAVAAEQEGADYIGVGPVFETPTKPGRPAVGLELVRKIRQNIKIPFVAIGGIDHNNVSQVLEAGAERIAVVRTIFGAANPYDATHKLREQIENFSAARAHD